MMQVTFQEATTLQREDRGIDGTDAALLVEINGELIGYTDDYGSFTPFGDFRYERKWVEEAAEAVCSLFAEHTGLPVLEPKKVYTVLVTWTNPEPGAASYGPYESKEEAAGDVGRLLYEYHDAPCIPSGDHTNEQIREYDEWNSEMGIDTTVTHLDK